MICKEFDELSDRIKRGVASAQEAERFVTYATELRHEVIDFVMSTDTADQNHQLLGYTPYHGGGDDWETIVEWAR